MAVNQSILVMDDRSANETWLTGANDGHTSCVDEKTLAFTPKPMAASTVVRSNSRERRNPDAVGGSFLNITSQQENNGVKDDRSSLGLLPSGCLLGMSESLLALEPIDFSEAAAALNTQPNLVDSSSSSREQTADSQDFLTTIKKCPPASGAASCFAARQALFQSVVEEEEEEPNSDKSNTNSGSEVHCDHSDQHQVSDSGMGQSTHRSKTSSAGDERNENANFGAEVWNQRRTDMTEHGDSCFVEPQGFKEHFLSGEQRGQNSRDLTGETNEEADHTVHQVELEAEDLKELEDSFSDFEEDLSEGENNGLIEDNAECDQPTKRIITHIVEDENMPVVESLPPTSCIMDGPFKMPLPPKKTTLASNHMVPNTERPDKESADNSLATAEPSVLFGSSIPFDKTQGTGGWGPSLNFDQSFSVVDFSAQEKLSEVGSAHLSHNNTESGDREGKSQNCDPEEKEIQENVEGRSQPEILTSAQFQGNCDKIVHPFDNPFDMDAEEQMFQGDLEAQFTDDDFLDNEAGLAMLKEDQQLVMEENFLGNQTSEGTFISEQDPEKTYCNMTIGTFMAAGSENVGSLGGGENRPDLGMSIRSPPIVRTSNEQPLSPFGDSPLQDDLKESPRCPTTQANSFTSLEKSPQPPVVANVSNDQVLSCRSPQGHHQLLSESLGSNTAMDFQSSYPNTKIPSISFPDNYTSGESVNRNLSPAFEVAERERIDYKEQESGGALSLSDLPEASKTIDSTSSDFNFSNIFKLLENNDFDPSNISHVLRGELNHQKEKKKVAKRAQALPYNEISYFHGEKVQSPPFSGDASLAREEESHFCENKIFKKPQDFFPREQKSCNKESEFQREETKPASKRNSYSVVKSGKPQGEFISNKNPQMIKRSVSGSRIPVLSSKAKPNAYSKPVNRTEKSVNFRHVETFSSENTLLPANLTTTLVSDAASALTTEDLVHDQTDAVSQFTAQDMMLESMAITTVESRAWDTTSTLAGGHSAMAPLPPSSSKPRLDTKAHFEGHKQKLDEVGWERQTKDIGFSNANPAFLNYRREQPEKPLKDKGGPERSGLHEITIRKETGGALREETSMVQEFHSLQESALSMLQHTEIKDDFASSTPMVGHQHNPQGFASMICRQEKSILPMVTPKPMLNILELPDVVQVPEACCVQLSQQTTFNMTNLLPRGVKCLMTIQEATFKGQRIQLNMCPFEIKPQIIFQPHSTERVQVIFRPKDQGEFTACLEVFSQNMTNSEEKRSYNVILSAYAEYPCLKIAPKNEELDFGDMLWGSTECRSLMIQNVGRATVPLRFSIFRTESSLCSFSFHPEQSCDVSSISLTNRPAAVGSVFAVSLPGVRRSEDITTETIQIYCKAKEAQNINQKYLERAEYFQAILTVGVDMPIQDIAPMTKFKLKVKMGMFKLHVDKDSLPISVAPGKTGKASLKVINSGNIPMPMQMFLEPHRDHFSVKPESAVVPPSSHIVAEVTFTPQPTRKEAGENKTNLVLRNQMMDHSVPVSGRLKMMQTKISGSASSLTFGGIDLGQKGIQKFTFITDNDADMSIWLRGSCDVFKLLKHDGTLGESTEGTVMASTQYSTTICFFPTEAKGYSADLVVEAKYGNRYSIPMAGYGGRSSLEMLGVSQAESGERWLEFGHLSTGTSVFRKIKVKNSGVRCCYVKTAFYDIARRQLSPHRATSMPSAMILPPGESAELLVMFNPTKDETELCTEGRSLVGILKLTTGDEITRQLFLKQNSKQKNQHFIDYDIPLTAAQKEMVSSELEIIPPSLEHSNLLKTSMTVMKIGLFGVPQEDKATEKVITLKEEQGLRMPSLPMSSAVISSSSNSRPALRQVSQNLAQGKITEEWTVSPKEMHLLVGDVTTKDFAQIINFSDNDLRFSIDCDKGVMVAPERGIIQAKSNVMLTIWISDYKSDAQASSPRCGLIRIHCQEKVQYIRFFVSSLSGGRSEHMKEKQPSDLRVDLPPPERSSLAITTTVPSGLTKYPVASARQESSMRQRASVDQLSPSSFSLNPSSQSRQASSMIQASDMVIFPTSETNACTELSYTFTNIGSEILKWELSPFAPPYVKHANSTQNVYRVKYEVFSLHPESGKIGPDEMKTIQIQFQPQCKGSYNQAWSIHCGGKGHSSTHMVTIYAKACAKSSAQENEAEEETPAGCVTSTLPASPRGQGRSHSSQAQARDVVSLFNNQSSGSHSLQGNTNRKSKGFSYVSGHDATENLDRVSAGLPESFEKNRRGKDNSKRNLPEKAEAVSSISGPGSHGTSSPRNMSTTSTLSSGKDGSISSRHEKDHRKTPQLHLIQKTLTFPTLPAGKSTVLKVQLKNPTPDDIQIVVEHEPQPPFLIRHFTFKISKDRVVMFPVFFKPKHQAKFKDKVVFRDTRSGDKLTAVIEGECL